MVAVAWLVAVALGMGCSDDGSSTSGDPPDDGKFRPAPSGVQTTETAACEAIHDKLFDRAQALGCVKTLRPCPDLLRSVNQQTCVNYDQGTLDACLAYYDEQTACEGLDESQCVLVTYPGTEPAGCP